MSGCDSPTDPEPPPDLRGGIVATFAAGSQRFNVWIRNRTTIAEVFAVQQGTSQAHIPNGRILRGPGAADHNAPYSWHLDPNDITMAEVATEVCDGAPSFVEENVDEFVDKVGRYCPWAAELVDIADYR